MPRMPKRGKSPDKKLDDARMARTEKKDARKTARAEKKQGATERVPLRVPAGTPVSVRTGDTIKIENAQLGDKCPGTVDYDVKVDDRVAIPAGSRVRIAMVQMEGGDDLGMRLSSITIDGRDKPVKTDLARVEGEKDGMGLIGKAAIGAAVGGLGGGGKGAAAGAAAGAGIGAMFGPDKEVPSGTRLAFDLREPLRLER